MSSSREGPNPLRPYYIPPSIGPPPPDPPGSTSSVPHNISSRNGTAPTYASSARDIFSDIDYSDYVPEGSLSTVDIIKELLDQALYKYTSVLLAQPFEVATTVLQVRNQATGDGSIPIADTDDTREDSSTYKEIGHGEASDHLYQIHGSWLILLKYISDESDPDEPAYFTSSAPQYSAYSPPRSRRRHITDRSGYVVPSPGSSLGPHQLVLKRSDSILEVISQLWTVEGAWGVWKGSNATFIYSVLFKTVETWSRSLIAAIVNVPDPGLIAGLGLNADVADSPYPWASLSVAVAAAAMAGLVLAPLDIVRTKLIMTTTSSPKRSFIQNVRMLPSYTCPPSIVLPTILHSIISPLMMQSTSLLLRARLTIDPILTPMTFSIATFCTSVVELFVKLPIETVLRRGQLSVVSSSKYIGSEKKLETIVNVGQFRGMFGTMWLIMREEGGSTGKASAASSPRARGSKKTAWLRERKGQGIQGLWRGWRVGIWGLIGIWGAATLGGGANSGGEF